MGRRLGGDVRTRLTRALVAPLFALAAMLASSPAADAQGVDPTARWRTLRTAHFDVHFTPELEEPARRAAADAERAYCQLARDFPAPRGRVDLVIADNVDYSNGSATPVPSNRIIIYAHPALDTPSLRFYDDWIALVITHELTHIFHLDRAGGWWKVAQKVFGRSPWFMPNNYAPAWVTEGLAVYYESALTGAGRVRGSYEPMLARASMLEEGLPRLDEWSLTTSRYPGGDIAYGFGSLFLDYLARTRGRAAVVDFINRSSRAPLPWALNYEARRSFGVSFTDAWREWRDTLRAGLPRAGEPLPAWRDLTRPGWVTVNPRWLDGRTLLYSAATARESPAAYRVDTAGRVRRAGRRNSTGPNVPLADGGILFAQLEFSSAYELRSDLFVQRGGRQMRLTRGARLTEPDAREGGDIVAVRVVPASNQLVRLSRDGARIAALTSASPDTQWAEPRWSPRGDRIAVTRWTRGGFADVVVLDTAGRLVAELTHDRAFDASPSWSADGREVYFSSDRTGTTQLYVAAVPDSSAGDSSAPAAVRLLSTAATGLFYPDPSPDGTRLAAAYYRANGLHVGVGANPRVEAEEAAPPPAAGDPVPAARRDSSPARGYSPWRTLLPRYWLPVVSQTASGGTSFGGTVSGRDVLRRHAYSVEALFDPQHADHELFGGYRYARLGQPLLDVDVSQFWDRGGIINRDREVVGTLRRRSRVLGLAATFVRPRVRTNAFLSVGGEMERRRFTTEPESLLARLDPSFAEGVVYRALRGSAGWSNLQRPSLSISPEDGVALSGSTRVRWLAGESQVQSRSLIGLLSAYKSLDLPGYAHHVLAARVVSGYSAGPIAGGIDVGGESGETVEVLPGLAFGGRHTFGVRGFSPGALIGRHALAASAEYRMPAFLPSRGLGLWPVFLDRTSISLFADAGSAWDPFVREWIASAGGEFSIDAAAPYDVPYRIRLGAAFPIRDRLGLAPAAKLYVQAGLAF